MGKEWSGGGWEVEQFGNGNPNEGYASRSALFAALPPPKAEFDSSRVKVEAGSGNAKVKKQVVAFKPPIDVSVPKMMTMVGGRAQKRAKAEPGVAATGGWSSGSSSSYEE